MAVALIDQDADIPQWTLGDRLRKSLSDRGLTQIDAMHALGKGKGTVSGWVTDAHLPTYSEMKDWALFTRVPLWWLMGVGTGPEGETSIAYQALKREWRGSRSRWDALCDLGLAA